MNDLADYIEEVLKDSRWVKQAKKLHIDNFNVNYDTSYQTGNTRYQISFTYHPRKARNKNAESFPYTLTFPLAAFAGCCGVYILHEMSYEDEYAGRYPSTICRKGIGSFLLRVFVEAYRRGARAGDHRGYGSMLVGATASYQKAGVKLCRAARFRRIATKRNPNSGNAITFWLKTV